MAKANQNGDNTARLSLSFFSQTVAQSAARRANLPASPTAAPGRIRRNKKNLGFRVDNSN